MAYIGKLNVLSYSSSWGCFVHNNGAHQEIYCVCAESGGWSFSEWVLFAALLAFLIAFLVSEYYRCHLRSMELEKRGLPLETKTLPKQVPELRAVLERDMHAVKERLGINELQTSISELRQAVDRLNSRIRNRRRELNNNNTR